MATFKVVYVIPNSHSNETNQVDKSSLVQAQRSGLWRKMIVGVLASFVSVHWAQADVITLSAFSNPTVETFENILGISVPVDFQAFGHPPTGFRFPSGLTLVAPNPNPPRGLVIGDFRVGRAIYGLGNGGEISSPADLHSGTAYASADGDAGTFRFAFNTPVNLVGVFVSPFRDQPGEAQAPITLSIFDTSGNTIESDLFPSIPPPPLRGGNFIGVGSDVPLGSFEISSPTPFFVFDDVTFEGTAVPEPPGLILVSIGTFGLIALGLRTGELWRVRPLLTGLPEHPEVFRTSDTFSYLHTSRKAA
jgi:hypothetical protein